MARIVTEETSLSRRRRLLQLEVRLLSKVYWAEIFGGAALLLVGLVLLFWKGHKSVAVLGGVLLFMGYGHWLKNRQNDKEVHDLDAGSKGEAKVARLLAESLDNTHYLFNDLLLRNGFRAAQIDHLVIGPQGVFVIETKNWRGCIEGNGQDAIWTQHKREGEAPVRLKSPVAQVQRQAGVIAQILRGAKNPPAAVIPVVAFAMGSTELRVDSHDVPVIRASDLGAVISGRRSAQPCAASDVDEWVNIIARRS